MYQSSSAVEQHARMTRMAEGGEEGEKIVDKEKSASMGGAARAMRGAPLAVARQWQPNQGRQEGRGAY